MNAGSPKTVLHVVDGLGLSGKTRHLVSLVSHLDRRRFAPVVCSLSAESSPLTKQLRAAHVPLHTIALEDGLRPAAAVRLAQLAWSVNAAILHCYNPRPMLYAGLAARVLRIRATLGSLSAFACQLPDRGYGFLPQPLVTRTRRNVYRNRLAAAAMRFIVTVSSSLGRGFCEYNGIPLTKLRVVPYGADRRKIDRFSADQTAEFRSRLGLRPDDVVVGSVGRLVEQKDYRTELQAFALAARRAPQLRLAIAGDGPLREPLENLARELGVAAHVRFLGHCEDVPLLLRSVDVFAIASKFEPFGVAILEAKAAGLPIVATAVNEIPTLIEDGRSGLLTPAGDVPRMAALFVKLAEDRDCRARLGRRAGVEAEQHRLEDVVAQYERLYDECAAPNGQLPAVAPTHDGARRRA